MIMTALDHSRRSFLRASAALVGAAPFIADPRRARSDEAGGPLIAYVGTFSSPLRDMLPTQVDLPPGNGRGIHLFRVDRTTGALTPAGIHEMGTSPSCLVPNAAGTRMYSANETDRVGDDKSGSVSAFAVDRADGKLEPLNTVRSGGAGPTYVSVHPSGRFVLVANYFGGSVAVLPILPDGRLGDAADIKKDAGKIGPTKATHAPPGSLAISGHDRTHAHMIQADPSGRFVLHVDLGLDRIFVWKFDDRTGKLSPNEPPDVSLPPGDGPRHFHFHPNGRWLYSIQEEGSTVVLFDYDAATGRLAPRQTVLHPAARIRRQQLLLRDPGLGRRAIRLCGQSAPRQHRDLLRRPERRPDLPRGRVDPRGLSAELQLRPHRPVPLLLQPARGQCRPPSGWIARPAASHSPAITRPSATLRASSSSTSPGWAEASEPGPTPSGSRADVGGTKGRSDRLRDQNDGQASPPRRPSPCPWRDNPAEAYLQTSSRRISLVSSPLPTDLITREFESR